MKLSYYLRIVGLIGIIILFAFNVQAETIFVANLDGLQEVPSNNSLAAGTGTVILNDAETHVTITLYFDALSSPQTAAHIHSPAPVGANAGVIQTLPSGNFSQAFSISPAEVANLKNGLWYFNVHTGNFPNGEIRGQIESPSGTNSVAFPFSNGSLDTTFAMDGIVTTKISDDSVAQAVAIQADGKIVVAGFDQTPGNTDFAIVRYNPDGSLDNTFAGDGTVTTPIGTGFEEAFAVAIQTDGKIIAAGRTLNGADTDFAIVRYNSDGSLDTSFDGNSGNGNGIVTTTIGSGNEIFRGLAIQTDGKILAVGDSFDGSNATITVIRYNSDGTLDTGFDGNSGIGNGVVTTRIGSGNEHLYGVKIQTDGKIVATGYYSNGVNNDVALLRYNPDGVLDTTFDDDGIAVTAIGTQTDEAFDLALQTDGKIVVIGCINSGGGNDFLAIRYKTNGSLDETFGTDGATVTPIGSTVEIAFGVAIQTDGKIVSAGFSRNADNDFALIRQNPDGSLDTSFDGDGKLTTQLGTSVEVVNGVAIQADGKIVAVGRAVIDTRANFGVVRYGYGTNPATDDGFFRLNQSTEIRFDNAFEAGTTIAQPTTALGLPPLPAKLNLINSPQIIQTMAMFSNDILVKFTLPNDIDEANFNAARVLQFENGAWVDRITNTPPRDFSTRTIYARVQNLSAFAIVSPLMQTATSISLSGRALSAEGRYAAGVIVTFTDENEQVRYAVTNPFGYFLFKNVSVNEPFIFRVSSKRFQFAPRILSVHKDFGQLNLNAQF